MAEHTINITLISYSCAKGHFYATVKDTNNFAGCPYCLKQDLLELRQTQWKKDDQINQLNRTISALKGALTKKKK